MRLSQALTENPVAPATSAPATSALATSAPATGTQRLVFVVGPEGGISDAELDALRAVGARPVLLGPTILRSSSAGPAALVMAQNSLGRW